MNMLPKPCSCKYTVTFLLISFIALSLPQSASRILRFIEGEKAELSFQYPCFSTDVTLRHGYKLPFYSLAHPEAKAMPQRHKLFIQNSTDGDICLIHLTINPVKRTDEGTYILTVYRDGQLLDEYTVRIGVRIDYPPDKASCELSEQYVVGDWVSLHCTAAIGTQQGQIECYQRGFRTPPVLATPVQNDKTMEQSFWVIKHSYPTFCCTSVLHQPKEMCKCHDYVFDPSNPTNSNIKMDPCPTTTSQGSSFTQYPTDKSATMSLASVPTIPTAVPQLRGNTNFDHVHVALLTIVCILTLLLFIIVIVYIVHGKKRQRENVTATHDQKDETINLKEGHSKEHTC